MLNGPLQLHSSQLLVSLNTLSSLFLRLIFHIGPLAGSFPILSLRTNKADVAVGVEQAAADELDARGEKWRVNGK